jgi:hypothetical protein
MREKILENLYKEIKLIKELISIDPERYSFLKERPNEIKKIINEQSVFLSYPDISQKIINDSLIELIKEE